MEALTHSSFANERGNGIKSNERMEFLGDSVLSLVSSQLLFETYPDTPEGELTKLKASLVCTESLSGFARQINLGDYLFLGKGEVHTNGAQRPSILERQHGYLHLPGRQGTDYPQGAGRRAGQGNHRHLQHRREPWAGNLPLAQLSKIGERAYESGRAGRHGWRPVHLTASRCETLPFG